MAIVACAHGSRSFRADSLPSLNPIGFWPTMPGSADWIGAWGKATVSASTGGMDHGDGQLDGHKGDRGSAYSPPTVSRLETAASLMAQDSILLPEHRHLGGPRGVAAPSLTGSKLTGLMATGWHEPPRLLCSALSDGRDFGTLNRPGGHGPAVLNPLRRLAGRSGHLDVARETVEGRRRAKDRGRAPANADRAPQPERPQEATMTQNPTAVRS